MPPIFDYSYKPDQNDLVVCLVIEGCDDVYPNLFNELKEHAKRFGVKLVTQKIFETGLYSKSLFKHLIILAKSDNPIEFMEQHKSLLSQYNCMSIGFIYSSHKAMTESKDAIEKLKSIYTNDKVNFLRPDTCENGTWFCSKLKVLDNAICDTIRIKYLPIKKESEIPEIPLEYQNFFNQCSKFYTQYKLYHRSASDGFFAIRYKNGIYVTATKTYKNPLDLRRISYVHDYDEASNKMIYSGPYLPSSDAVEAWIVFNNNPDIKAIIHTHASEAFTRNPAYKYKVKVPKSSYGIPEVGYLINNKIKEYPNDFLILQEHGEYFSFNHNEPDKIIKHFHQILKDTLCENRNIETLATQ